MKMNELLIDLSMPLKFSVQLVVAQHGAQGEKETFSILVRAQLLLLAIGNGKEIYHIIYLLHFVP